ncbi:sulfate transporter [Candidatus Magnetoovum chiemensis]|nr:sulfate transporter [Candidatus Magnetoovum chiemensis]
MIAALFGSSRQLATGPVAVVSLMSAASLAPLASAGSEAFIAYSILLALLVGFVQFSLGFLRLGFVVNFLSHPVVLGFTNAAAIIIATSQLSKIFGVFVDSAEHHYETVINVLKAALHYTHLPTLIISIFAFAIMITLKRINPKIPNVLVAVVLTTSISWLIGFEKKETADINNIKSPEVAAVIKRFNEFIKEINEYSQQRTENTTLKDKVAEEKGKSSIEYLEIQQQIDRDNLLIEEAQEKAGLLREKLRSILLSAVIDNDGKKQFYVRGSQPKDSKTDGVTWRLKIGGSAISDSDVSFIGGAEVIGKVPSGLPAFAMPKLNLHVILSIFPTALIISILGFMEAISIAKAMATRTGQRLNPNQELIGQGLANIIGAIGKSYAVSGSFSRSAVNLQAGAVTGLSSVFTSFIVLITLMFLTPLLYHLPQGVLAAVIMMAVMGLINIKGIKHIWHAQRSDAVISIVTFFFTLLFAPHLDKGIMIGVVLSLGLYLYRNMKPRVFTMSKHEDGTLRNSDLYGLNRCEHISIISFDGSLFFANATYLEDQVLELISAKHKLKHVVIIGSGINSIDASGEESLSILVDRLRDRNIEISFVGLKEQVIDVFKRTKLYDKIGQDNFYRTEEQAIKEIHAPAHEASTEKECPLLHVCYINPIKREV